MQLLQEDLQAYKDKYDLTLGENMKSGFALLDGWLGKLRRVEKFADNITTVTAFLMKVTGCPIFLRVVEIGFLYEVPFLGPELLMVCLQAPKYTSKPGRTWGKRRLRPTDSCGRYHINKLITYLIYFFIYIN